MTRASSIFDLLKRCCQRPVDEQAWQEFVRRYHPLIQASAHKTLELRIAEFAFSPDAFHSLIVQMTDSVYQRLIEEQCRELRAARCRNDEQMRRFLTMVTVRVVCDHLQRYDEVATASDSSWMLR